MEVPRPQSRPRELAARISELGAFTEILNIAAPAEAVAGGEVEVSVTIKNLADFPIYISASGKYDDSIYYLFPEFINVAAGGTHIFTGSFTMPNKEVRVYAWSFYWTGSDWYQDDEQFIDLELATPRFSNLSCNYRRT